MDLRMFYQRMRKLEEDIASTHPVVVSVETPDGGRAGVKTEVNREMAAKLIVEGRARLATEEESDEFRKALKHLHKSPRRQEQ